MDRNQGIGVLLLFAVFIAYIFYMKPSPEELERIQFVQDSIEQAKLLEENPTSALDTFVQQEIPDSVVQANLNSRYGSFSNAMMGESQEYVLENDVIKVTFDSKGGRIKEATLKQHFKVTENKAHEQSKNPLKLLEDEKNRFEYVIPSRDFGNISTQDLFFNGQLKGNQLALTANLGQGRSIRQVYTLKDEGYHLDYKLELNGVNQLMNDDKIQFKWHNYLDRIELNTTFERYYSTVYFKETNEDSDYCNCRGDDKDELEGKRIDWVSNVNQFFNTSLMAFNFKYENGVFETVSQELDSPDLKLLKTEADIPLSGGQSDVLEMDMYIGPNEFNELLAYGNQLEEIIPFGRSIFGTINRWIIRPAFNWLSGFIGSKGIVIIVLIFIIKMILYPLMYKMLYSQAKMGALKPELQAMKDKYKDDQQKQQMETMKLYREYGVSPLGGCLPMLLQMPIWYALFRFFPASITFRQEPFLWATDLSSFDVMFWLPESMHTSVFGAHVSLFTILWAISTIIYSYYNMKHMDMSANPMMKYVQYFMPITFLVFFNTYASGLTCYMFFSNLFNISQTLVTKKLIFNEDKIREDLLAEKNKPKKKKGGFQERLEKALQEQQELAKKKQQQGRKKKKR